MINGTGSRGRASNLPRRPYFPDVGVIAFVPDEWEIPWQLRHQVLSRLAQYFYVVWFIPSLWWREWWQRAAPRNEDIGNGPPPTPSLTIYRPEKYLPAVGRPQPLGRWLRRQRLRRAQRTLRTRGCSKTILYFWRPQYAPALDLIDYHLSCYHIDDEYTFSEVERPLDEREARLISHVDQVFIHSPALLEKKAS